MSKILELRYANMIQQKYVFNCILTNIFDDSVEVEEAVRGDEDVGGKLWL